MNRSPLSLLARGRRRHKKLRADARRPSWAHARPNLPYLFNGYIADSHYKQYKGMEFIRMHALPRTQLLRITRPRSACTAPRTRSYAPTLLHSNGSPRSPITFANTRMHTLLRTRHSHEPVPGSTSTHTHAHNLYTSRTMPVHKSDYAQTMARRGHGPLPTCLARAHTHCILPWLIPDMILAQNYPSPNHIGTLEGNIYVPMLYTHSKPKISYQKYHELNQ